MCNVITIFLSLVPGNVVGGHTATFAYFSALGSEFEERKEMVFSVEEGFLLNSA